MRRVPKVLVAFGGLLVVLAVLSVVLAAIASGPPPPPGAGTPGPILPTAAAPTAPTVVSTPLPIGVRIPALGVDSDLIETGVNPDGTAEVPPLDQPLVASWLTESPRPGDVGPAVLYGHVDGHGQAGVFARLAELRPGDEVLVERDQAPDARFVVYQVQQMPKDAFDTDLVYGDTTGAELRLITCAGGFDRSTGHYRDNLAVLARLATA